MNARVRYRQNFMGTPMRKLLVLIGAFEELWRTAGIRGISRVSLGRATVQTRNWRLRNLSSIRILSIFFFNLVYFYKLSYIWYLAARIY